MERESQQYKQPLTAIHIDLIEQAVEFEDRYGTVDRIPFVDGAVVADGVVLWSSSTPPPDDGSAIPTSLADSLDDYGPAQP